jgi:hypothetical protein
MLLNLGCTTDMLSAQFAEVVKVQLLKLAEPVQLQMVCISSCSTINYGGKPTIELGDIHKERYFNIVNIDKYNAVLGTPFLHSHKVMLNFENEGAVIVDGVQLVKGLCPHWLPLNHNQKTKRPHTKKCKTYTTIAPPKQLVLASKMLCESCVKVMNNGVAQDNF